MIGAINTHTADDIMISGVSLNHHYILQLPWNQRNLWIEHLTSWGLSTNSESLVPFQRQIYYWRWLTFIAASPGPGVRDSQGVGVAPLMPGAVSGSGVDLGYAGVHREAAGGLVVALRVVGVEVNLGHVAWGWKLSLDYQMVWPWRIELSVITNIV